MVSVRFVVVALIVLLTTSQAGLAIQAPGSTVKIAGISPVAVDAGTSPVDITVFGSGFAKKAVVRARVKATKGAGVDCATVFESATSVRATLPADLVRKPATLEVRVKNPDESVSDWYALEVRTPAPVTQPPAPGPRKPVVERITPAQVQAGSRNIHVTIHGKDLKDASTIKMRSGPTSAEARANLVDQTLVFQVPAGLLDKPRTVIVTVVSPDGQASDTIPLEIVEAKPGLPGESAIVAISQLNPDRVDMRGVKSQRVDLLGQGIDEKGAKVLLRGEGENSTGKAIPIVARASATNGIVLTVEVTPNMLPTTGVYELRVVNPDGRQSNWYRLQVTNAGAGGKTIDATVSMTVPKVVTLTSSTITIPIEIDVRNIGTTAIRLGNVALLTPDKQKIPVEGTIEIVDGARKTARLEAPAPLGLGAKSVKPVDYRFVVSYDLSSLVTKQAPESHVFPETDTLTTSIKNEIALSAIGRDYVAAETQGGPEGWRFFKVDNPDNAETGKNADFFLFTDALGTKAKGPSEELVNYRPDPNAANERGLFYLVLRGSEIETLSKADAKKRERGTRLGFVATASSDGLVPLYRWVRLDGDRAANHFLTVTNDPSKLPRQMQRGGWKLDTIVGYVVARDTTPKPR